jgi:hypothetical protein
MQPAQAGQHIGGMAEVSILIQPEGRMQPAQAGQHIGGMAEVSILIQPEGRMQRQRAFQHGADVFHVSILIQPEGRMQLGPGIGRVHADGFQSSSSQKAGCNLARASAESTQTGFNPHPARRPDATPVSEFPSCSARTS